MTISLLATIGYGLFFSLIQFYEYNVAPFSINDSVYGTLFFVLTGFHGLHSVPSKFITRWYPFGYLECTFFSNKATILSHIKTIMGDLSMIVKGLIKLKSYRIPKLYVNAFNNFFQ